MTTKVEATRYVTRIINAGATRPDEFDIEGAVNDMRDMVGSWSFYDISEADFYGVLADHVKMA
jgi:hypothetical protein